MLDQLARLEAATALIHDLIREGASYPTIVNRLIHEHGATVKTSPSGVRESAHHQSAIDASFGRRRHRSSAGEPLRIYARRAGAAGVDVKVGRSAADHAKVMREALRSIEERLVREGDYVL